ncbi:MAG: hypothetical protein OER96_12890, partial [Gammaproteobacteria bacterium]|nr:hypothetical protein [Gammaproteobacteria bacterium]
NVDLPLLEGEGGESSGDEEDVDVNDEAGTDIDNEFDDDLDLIVESNMSDDTPGDVYKEQTDDMDAEDDEEPGVAEIDQRNKVAVAANPNDNIEIGEETLAREMGD